MPLLVSLACTTPKTPNANAVPKHISGRRTTRISEGGDMVLPNAKVSERSQPTTTLNLPVSESAGSDSLHRLVDPYAARVWDSVSARDAP
jgi:hypothetical protein